ncbi:MAG TPA: ACT domain-containing protein [Anaerolineales bacterium]|nr:ACT domain-containing protein [Anaerolineales bacterium]
MTWRTLTLIVLPARLAVCQLPADAPAPVLPEDADLLACIRTADELTVVCSEALAPEGARVEGGWRALMLRGPLDLSLVGVLAELSNSLAQAGVSIFVLSTFNTDYILVKEDCLEAAQQALRQGGCVVEG